MGHNDDAPDRASKRAPGQAPERATQRATERVRRRWDSRAAHYDRGARWEPRFLTESRAWLCGRAQGATLEVAVGTGRNLDYYDPDVELTGVDVSDRMLAGARAQAQRTGRAVDLRQADAQHLPFPDSRFDSVVCALALCTIPDQRAAVAEMWRVLRPEGRLLIVDHVEYTRIPMRWVERYRSTPRTRPLRIVREQGFAVDEHDRFVWGLVERVAAHRPG